MRQRLPVGAGGIGEILGDDTVEDPVGPAVAVAVGLATHTLARVPRKLRMPLSALVEAVDLELEPVEPEIDDQVALEQACRLDPDPPAAEPRIDGEPAKV